jgi:hypothetical protein
MPAWQQPAQLPGPQAGRRHDRPLQTDPDTVQSLHSAPPTPQALSEMPDWQAPEESQQPLHVWAQRGGPASAIAVRVQIEPIPRGLSMQEYSAKHSADDPQSWYAPGAQGNVSQALVTDSPPLKVTVAQHT